MVLSLRLYYWHGNEPDIHAAYLFNVCGRPDRTQYWIRHILENEYSTEPEGIAGNDDYGALSAWYVFSASGFYPVAGQELRHPREGREEGYKEAIGGEA